MRAAAAGLYLPSRELAHPGHELSLTRLGRDYRRMSAAQRRAAAASIYLASESVRARSVLLIDDVVTRGAPAGDAIKPMLAAGATEVRFACVARTIGRDEEPPRERTAIAALAGLAAASAGAVRCVRG
jgi:phosphoribosylpyrophosphate synthetase